MAPDNPPGNPPDKPPLPSGPAETASTAGLSSNPSLPNPQRPQASGQAGAQHPTRPAGELGGHTVQPWEQGGASGAKGMERKPTSKDVPPPQAGAPEAKAASPGPGKVTTPAPGNVPSRQGQAGGTASAAQPGPADAGVAAQEQAATPQESASLDDAHAGAPATTRPARPPVYAPQQGHEPAPRPPPSHQPPGAGTDGDRLVEAISRAIAENLGKAFHQSVAQAVREVFPLSARTVDSGMPSSNGKSAAGQVVAKPAVGQAPAATKGPAQPAKGQVTPAPSRGGSAGSAGSAGKVTPPEGTTQAGAKRSDAGTGQHPPASGAGRETAASASPGPSGSKPTGQEPQVQPGTTQAVNPTQGHAGAGKPTAPQPKAGQAAAPDGRTGPAQSMFGGTIEPPVPVPPDKSPPGNAAAASADEQTREGNLV